MFTFLDALRVWWRWRMTRAGVHIYGVNEYRVSGVVTGRDGDAWVVKDEGERVYRCRPDAGFNPGDRVEIEPMFQSTSGSRLNLTSNWIILRRL